MSTTFDRFLTILGHSRFLTIIDNVSAICQVGIANGSHSDNSLCGWTVSGGLREAREQMQIGWFHFFPVRNDSNIFFLNLFNFEEEKSVSSSLRNGFATWSANSLNLIISKSPISGT